MITEDYVSFETAKLLKEKGFDGNCYKVWVKESKPEPKLCAAPSFVEGETVVNRESVEDAERYMNSLNLSEYRIEGYLAPTVQMARKWLRDVHNLIISVNFTVHGWLCDITRIFRDSNGFIVNINHGIGDDVLPYCDEYEQSCEAAIKYCLENLI